MWAARRIGLAGAAAVGGGAYAYHSTVAGCAPQKEVLAAAPHRNSGSSFGTYIKYGGLTIAVGGAFLAFANWRYRTCAPNQLLVVYGMGKGEGGKIQKGGGAFVLPIVQQWKTLSMEPMALEVKLGSALSLERIRVNIPSVFTVAVSDDEEKRVLAVSRLLTMTRAEIEYQAKEIITGQLRAVVAQMDIDEINLDRKKFNGMIEELVGDELDKIGLTLINVNITDINDASGKIEAQGKKAAAESIEKARVAEAMERRNGASGVAEADKLRETEVAQHVAAKDIGIKESDQMQRERIAAIEATAVEAENEATGRIATSKATLQVTQAEAYEEGESRERESRARVEELEAKAFAEAAKAQAERIEMDKRAELEAPAKAMKSKIITDAEADAEATIINARGKADATFIQMEAEAKGHYELLDKKAQGLGALVAGCGGSDAAFQLLMLEHVDTIAETSAKAISNIKFDKVTVWDTGAGAGNGSSTTADFIRSLTQSLPPTMEVIEKVAGVDLPKLGESKAAKE